MIALGLSFHFPVTGQRVTAWHGLDSVPRVVLTRFPPTQVDARSTPQLGEQPRVSPLPCTGPPGPPQPARPHLSGPRGQLTFMVGSFSTRGRQYTGTGTFFIRVSSWPPLGLSCNHKAEATWARGLGRALRRWGRGGTVGLPRRLPSCCPACPSTSPRPRALRPLQHLLVLGRQAPAAGLQPPIVVAHVLAHLAVLLALLLPAGGRRAVTGQEARRLLPAQAGRPALHAACPGPGAKVAGPWLSPHRQHRHLPVQLLPSTAGSALRCSLPSPRPVF